MPVAVDASTERAFYCANPECPSRHVGRTRVVAFGYLAPGSMLSERCERCHGTTTITVDSGGIVEYRYRQRL